MELIRAAPLAVEWFVEKPGDGRRLCRLLKDEPQNAGAIDFYASAANGLPPASVPPGAR